jgi:hypothetical protein
MPGSPNGGAAAASIALDRGPKLIKDKTRKIESCGRLMPRLSILRLLKLIESSFASAQINEKHETASAMARS